MKEKELRLALVCYGGVSLAVYMHGITKEIWKLQRASRAWRDARGRADAVAFSDVERTGRPSDTESVYFDLLARIGQALDLRVLVDIVAGASAGGINGVFLAQAISNDLSLEPLTDLWLRHADVKQLLEPAHAPRRWSKFYIQPLLWYYNRRRARQAQEMLGPDASDEVREKLSLLVRSRWFEPPFSGVNFAALLYEGLEAMQRTAVNHGSLLPPGHPLDLMVTVTDYHGQNQTLRLHSPTEISEREHRLIIGFHDPGTDPQGRRHLADLPSLAFAARATASFPGAFPPAHVGEIDQLLARRGQVWRERSAFIERLFPGWTREGRDPRTIALIDGSILNNKPFDAAIGALKDRPAHREVDRRIVYIEPYPRADLREQRQELPSFFGTVAGALSAIPRQQPIRDDLERLQSLTARLDNVRGIIASLIPDIERTIEDTLGRRLTDAHITADVIARWREIAQQRVAARAGFTYKAYAELKTVQVLDEAAALLCNLAGQIGTTARQDVQAAIRRWAGDGGILPVGPIGDPDLLGDHLPWVQFLRRYDLSFRIRRLRFVIRRTNDLYASTQLRTHEDLDTAKRKLYDALAPLLRLQTGTAQQLKRLPDFVRLHLDAGRAMTALGNALALPELDEAVDRLVAECLAAIPDAAVARQLLLAFVGFPFFDVVTLPMLEHGMEELEGVKVDRLSPADAVSLRSGGAEATLKGIEFGTFGAFLSRAYRENDYLWGRLHSAERMIDILLSSAAPTVELTAEEVTRFKQRAFLEILKAERPRLRAVTRLIDQLLAEVYARPAADAERIAAASGTAAPPAPPSAADWTAHDT